MHGLGPVRLGDQTAAQVLLTEWQSREPGKYRKFVEEIDALLTLLALSPLTDSTAASILSCALGRLRATRPRPIQFARQSDREAIGNAIIDVLVQSPAAP
jgi:hypothetical protein